ncbi:MAG: RraA family protein [Tissierellaceae bacterium]
MIRNKIGFSIDKDIYRTDKDILVQLREIGTCAISDAMKNFNTMHHHIKPVDEEIKFAGNAVTVRMRSADNLMLHKAIELAQDGDVIVVDTCGSESNSILGEMMTRTALKNGVVGIVIDGGIRDILELKKLKAPVFAKYITPALGDKHGPGEINCPISCGGVSVNPGDIIVGDANGVVVVNREIVKDVLVLAKEKIEQDNKWLEEILNGVTIKSDVDRELKYNGVI